MSIDELLDVLSARAIQLQANGNELIIRGDQDALDSSLMHQLHLHKSSLLDRLQDQRNEWWGAPLAITPAMLSLVHLTQQEIEKIVANVPGGAANVQDIYPLTPLQEGILFHYLMIGEGDAYLRSNLFAVDTPEHLDKFLSAFQLVIDRHDILRTALAWEGLKEPVQVVWRKVQLPVEQVVLEEGGGAAAEQLYRRFDPLHHRIDLRQAPMLRVCVAFDPVESRSLMLIRWHHMIGDQTTWDVIQKEIRAYLLGRQSMLPIPLAFRGFVAQARLRVSQEEHEVFFRQMLGNVDEPTAPFALLDVQDGGSEIKEAQLVLPNDLAQRLRAQARRLRVSAASLFHLAWAQVVGKTSGREDVVFGTVLFGRTQSGEGADRAIGMFINTLPIRISVAEEGATHSVQRTHALLAELLHHENASLALAQRCSAVQAPAPLFSALLNYRHTPRATQASSDETGQVGQGIQALRGDERSNYPFALLVNDLGDGFSLNAHAPASIEPLRICVYMRTALESLTEALEVAPGKSMRALEVLPKQERHCVLYEWNQTRTELSADRFVHQLFEQQVGKTPNATALFFESQSLSYEDLNLRANQLAHYLRELGVGPDKRVAICIERSFEMIVALLGVLKAGGAYVPLDPAYPIERLHFVLQDSSPVALLTQSHLQELFLKFTNYLPILDLTASIPPWHSRAETNLHPNDIGLTANHLSYVIYTSGSSGYPKGVLVEHAGLCNYLTWALATYAPKNAIVSSSISFDATATSLFVPLLSGGIIHLLREGDEIDGLYEQLQQFRGGQLVKLTPSQLHVMGQRIISENTRTSVDVLVIGGEILLPSTINLWQKIQPGVRLVNEYGPTEATVGCCTFEITSSSNSSVPIGRPIANTQIYILDAVGAPVPVGVTGELYIGGAGVARGYLNRPDLTAEKFLKNPFVEDPEARMYRTGDLGRWLLDGNIDFLGRNDFQVKIRGFRIELGEIEARLSEHVGVREAVVLAREDEPGDKRLVAYYTVADPGGLDIEVNHLRAHLAATLPEYMVPAAYVRLESLPLTPNGKLDRRALPAPEADAYATRGYEAPVGEIETVLASIWAQVLKLDRVSRHDNFFDLGGHSLLAVRVMTRVQQALNIEVALQDLFTYPVLEKLALSLETAAHAELPVMTRAPRDGHLPLSFAQQRLWFLAQMDGGSSAYHISFSMHLSGELDSAALRRALDRILVRHDSLRTTFVLVDGEPVQQVGSAEQSRFFLAEYDLHGHSDADGELDRLRAEERGTPFDLEVGPLIRGRWIRRSKDEHILIFAMHHIVSDGWSMGIFRKELSILYSNYMRGESDPLPALSLQYADYAVWQRKWIEGELLQRQADYWKKTLAGTPALLELPMDHGRPAQWDYAGSFARLRLDEKLTAGLKELSRRHGTTLYMTLLAGWAALLGRLSGQQDVVTGTPVANRGRVEIEGLIGFFVNTLVLRLDLSGSPSIGQLLERVKAQALAAQHHQDIPFEQVVEIMRPVRSLAHSPLFQVMFAWDNNTPGTIELPELKRMPSRSTPDLIAKFDLTLSLGEAENCIEGGLEYATTLFERSTVERYLGYFRTLLEAMVADDTQVVDQLALLSPAERHQILYEWNETKTAYPSDQCVHQLFEQQVEKTPEAMAVIFEDDGLSYQELNRQANRLAHYLRDLGVRPDDRVAICVERSLEMIVGLLAVLKAGGAYVPLDPIYPIERLRFMLEDSAPVALLTQTHLKALFTGQNDALPIVDLVDQTRWKQQPETNPDPASDGPTPHHLAYIIYTSGSTGTPKGVMVTHLNVVNQIETLQNRWQFSSTDTLLQFASITFDVSVQEIFCAFNSGAALVLREERWIQDARLFWALCERYCVTFVDLPTRFCNFLLDDQTVTIPVKVRLLIIGGEAMSPTLIEKWREPDSYRPTLYNAYGPTETTVNATLLEVATNRFGKHSIGRPISNTQVYILDGYAEPVPMGVAGEIYIGGAGVARGYLNRPDLTAEKFVRNPFTSEADGRMYRTGDLGRWLSDGNIEFLGRNDFQVKIRGFRIELGEIEDRLMQHDGIREAVVIAREDTPGDKRLVAYYRVADEQAPEVKHLRAHLAKTLPEYMVPAAYVQLDALPLTPNGKLDRKALPIPDGDAFAVQHYEAPQGETELRLAQIWADVLRLDKVGRHDNFFALGGHSLLAVRLIERTRRVGFKLDVRSLFLNSTIAELAAALVPKLDQIEAPPNLIPNHTDNLDQQPLQEFLL